MSTNNKKLEKDNRVIILSLLLTAFLIAYLMFFKDLFKDHNTKLEEEMIKEAKEYVIKNNITTNKEIYLDNSILQVKLDSDCSITSGVIYDGNTYTPYLICTNYQSEILSNNKDILDYITLNGKEVMVLAKGMTYYEPGYISNDIVTITNNVGTEEGVYSINYKTRNSNNVAIRKVIIIDNKEINELFPTISLKGDEVIILNKGEIYEELGVTCKDIIDDDISNKVKIESSLDNQVPGEYLITYTVTNSRGYSNTIIRKVIVVDNNELSIYATYSPNNMTSSDVTINLNIKGNYQKIVYPNGSEGVKPTYIVKENGNYSFFIYDENNQVLENEVIIRNINKTIPVGSCMATTNSSKTEIRVDVDSSEISSFEYFVNGISLSKTPSSTYVSSVLNPGSVQVKVVDAFNNQNEITCSIINELTKEVVLDINGKSCLEGYTCYVQFDYDSPKYPFCAMSNNPSSCGGIGRNGSSITAVATAIAALKGNSSTNVLHNPKTVWEEVYPIDKNTGHCNGGCATWSRIREAIVNAGLTAPKKVINISSSTVNTLTEHLKKGYPVIVLASSGAYGSDMHYMTILSVRDDGYVFLSDPTNQKETLKGNYKGQKYYVDTWISINDLISGNVKEALLVGPIGVYEGK